MQRVNATPAVKLTSPTYQTSRVTPAIKILSSGYLMIFPALDGLAGLLLGCGDLGAAALAVHAGNVAINAHLN